METWTLEAFVHSGNMAMYIGLDVDDLYELEDGENSSNYLWMATATTNETASIRVRQTDPDFHLGATYFIYMMATTPTNLIVDVELKQPRSAYFLGNGNDYTHTMQHPIFNFWTLLQKYSFLTTKELVKYHVFRAPGGTENLPGFHKVQILIESLTPGMYPIIYLNHVQMEESAYYALGDLVYPSRENYDIAFGENPYNQLDQSVQVYQFIGMATAEHHYYTMAIYQENWGLTDNLKSDYQILVSVEVADEAEISEDALTMFQ